MQAIRGGSPDGMEDLTSPGKQGDFAKPLSQDGEDDPQCIAVDQAATDQFQGCFDIKVALILR